MASEKTALPSKENDISANAKFVIGCSDEDFQDQLDDDEVLAVVPPDGGWGWVVVFASFMCNMIVDGIIFTVGMLFPIMRSTFNCTNAEVAWISSLLGGFYLIFGPFVSALANAYGFRTVCILGAFVSCASCVISYFATSIEYLYLSFGMLGGLGFGLIYVPAVISTGFYFEKRRALATGIAVCGSGIGTFTLAPLINYLLTTLGDRWRIVFLVYGGISLSCAVFALAFRPLTASTGKVVKEEDMGPPGTPLLIRIKRARVHEMAQNPSTFSFSSYTSNKSADEIALNGDIKNMNMPLNAAKALMEHRGSLGPKRLSYISPVVAEPIIEESLEENGTTTNSDLNDDNKSSVEIVVTPPSTPNLTVLEGGPDFTKNSLLDTNKNQTENGPTVYNRTGSAPMFRQQNNIAFDHGRRPSRLALRTEASRPFYRDDIYYTGSLARLPEFKSSESMSQYHASVTNLPHDPAVFGLDQGLDESPSKFSCCPVPLCHVIVKIFDFSLLRSITFIILSVTGFMSLMALFVPFMFLPSYSQDLGISPEDTAFMMSLIGICNTVGRIIAGWISDHPKVDVLVVNNFALMIGGGATILLPFFKNVSMLYLYSVIFGLCVAAFASLRSILLVELLGLDKLTNAFGLLLLFQGIAATFGSPIAGAFVDITGQYTVSFYTFGAIFALSGALCIPLKRIKVWEDAKIDRKLRKEKYGVEE